MAEQEKSCRTCSSFAGPSRYERDWRGSLACEYCLPGLTEWQPIEECAAPNGKFEAQGSATHD